MSNITFGMAVDHLCPTGSGDPSTTPNSDITPQITGLVVLLYQISFGNCIIVRTPANISCTGRLGGGGGGGGELWGDSK